MYIINYGYIIDLEINEIVEEVMVFVLCVFKIFIWEDIIEINCYGGILIINCILELIMIYGVCMVELGEYIKCVFLNGCIDLF